MYFSDSYELRQLEKLMRSIPNFRPRGHGVVILRRYEYTEKDCDCRACPHHISRKKGCGTDKCPCINERITAGAATLKEAVAETMAAIQYPPFVKRLNQYLKDNPTGTGVDVQDDRFEVEVVGWGAGKESWGIRYQKIYGDMLLRRNHRYGSRKGPADTYRPFRLFCSVILFQIQIS